MKISEKNKINAFISHKALSEALTCPVCKAKTGSTNYLYRNGTFEYKIYRCNCCSLEFIRPLPLPEISHRQMDSVDDAEMFNSRILRVLHERLIIFPEIRMVRKIIGRKNFTMLDVGCGTGWISKIWADSGAVVTGIEPSYDRAEIARRRGIRVLSCFVEELDSEDFFDLIVIRHVVEHLEDPVQILKKLSQRLNSDGLLLIIVPNIDCIGRSLFDADWTWVLPWHCNFFNPAALDALLVKAGFIRLRASQTPSPLWYPESFTRKFPEFGRLFGFGALSILLFSPIAIWGWLTGRGDNLSFLAQKRLATDEN